MFETTFVFSYLSKYVKTIDCALQVKLAKRKAQQCL